MNIALGGRAIGGGFPVFIVAELSANHMQNFSLAVKTIRAMKKAGADAVKLQTYTPDTITINCANRYFQIRSTARWGGQTLYRLYEQAYMPWNWQPKLKKIAEDAGLIFFSTPFDRTAVDFLEKMGVPLYKVASCEITDIPLIKYIAKKNKPMIISTGIATRADIKEAVTACKRVGNNKIVLLKCTSAYPTPLDEVNLRMIPKLKKDFGCVVGVSDHAMGIIVSLSAVALGAKVIERHFTLDRNMAGPDSAFSLEPAEFREMVEAVRNIEKALGKADYSLTREARKSRGFSRSLFVVKDIKAGGRLSDENIRSIRPGCGLHPRYLKKVLGRKVKKYVRKGTPLKLDLLFR